MSTADQQPKSIRWARWSAVLIVLAIGGAAFVLSFAALRDLAVMAHTPNHLAWLFPVIVDGTIIQATIAVLALADSPERSFFTRVLVAGATVSIGGNIAHALVSGHGVLAAILAVIAPAALLLDTHGLAVLLRTRTPAPAEPTEEPADEPTEELADEPAEPAVTKPVEPTPVPAPPPVRAPIPPVPVRPTVPPPVRVVQPIQPPRPVAVPSGGN
ncbi:DUF2637 domain-containing protein [Nocardia neocaledoniensis]|uniref:Uncharacterized protein DUF2637 n=1 Tax=Nocardia neocaledoniensis TaxID=236511 RepID=A0A317NRW7_9NOCA|nr:DUF2637 domain-containing protein [Nocardia neocaledoniensis]PWV77835.1 uncharacterized protein DUF2637 [Nocardia neocaledoniensis]